SMRPTERLVEGPVEVHFTPFNDEECGVCGVRSWPVLVLLVALGCGKPAAPSGGDSTPGAAFLRARGTAIVDGGGNPIFLKGVSFGNQVWTNMALPDDHAEIDFQRLADMGATSTRFLLNYRTFEDDAAPYV